ACAGGVVSTWTVSTFCAPSISDRLSYQAGTPQRLASDSALPVATSQTAARVTPGIFFRIRAWVSATFPVPAKATRTGLLFVCVGIFEPCFENLMVCISWAECGYGPPGRYQASVRSPEGKLS